MDLMVAQNDLASSIVGDCPYGQWERIVADIEIAVDNDECQLDTLSFAVVSDDKGGFKNPYFETSPETHRAAFGLYKERLENGGKEISGIMIEIEKDGRYGFDLYYEKPERLNGVFNSRKADRLANYLENYRPA